MSIFSKFITTKQRFIPELLTLTNQPVCDELDYIITLRINRLMNEDKELISFLKVLKKQGITTERLNNILIKLFIFLEYTKESDLITEMQKEGFITNFDPNYYEKYFLEHTKIKNLIKFLNQRDFYKINKAAFHLDSKFIDQKNLQGDSLLIIASKQDFVGEEIIELIKTLIEQKRANVNQSGRQGLTALMHTVNTRYKNSKDKIR